MLMISFMQDKTLPATLQKPLRVFVASNLKDSAAKLQHYIVQMLTSLAALPRDDVFVSIYESGSKDATGC